MADPWTTISQCTEEVGRKTALLLVAWGFTPGWNGSLAFRGAPLQERYPDIAVRPKRINWSGTPVDIIIGLRVGAAFTMDSGVCPGFAVRPRNLHRRIRRHMRQLDSRETGSTGASGKTGSAGASGKTGSAGASGKTARSSLALLR